jgi:epoxyqueuosine reductase QueG
MSLKEYAKTLGADLCGIASIDRFEDMPAISNPKAIMPLAKSVIVVATRFLQSTLMSSSTIPYTIIRNYLSGEMDRITVKLSYFLFENGADAIPTGAIEPTNYNTELSKEFGLISLKNAAFQAGLGVIGKNTLLLTPEYGNMVWLGAVITSLEVQPDTVKTDGPCRNGCRICMDACPSGALDGSRLMDQDKCRRYAFGTANGGEWRIQCHACRSRCPLSKGYKEA